MIPKLFLTELKKKSYRKYEPKHKPTSAHTQIKYIDL